MHHIHPEQLTESLYPNENDSATITSNFPVGGKFFKFDFSAGLRLELLLQVNRDKIVDCRYELLQKDQIDLQENRWEPRTSSTYQIDGVTPEDDERLVLKPIPNGFMSLKFVVLDLSGSENKAFVQIEHWGGLRWGVEVVSDDRKLLQDISSNLMENYFLDDDEDFPRRFADQKDQPWPPLKPSTSEE